MQKSLKGLIKGIDRKILTLILNADNVHIPSQHCYYARHVYLKY